MPNVTIEALRRRCPPAGVSHVFLGSAPGSGSTMLGQALNAHPHCMSLVEVGLWHAQPDINDKAVETIVRAMQINKGVLNGGHALSDDNVRTILRAEGTIGLVRQLVRGRQVRPLAVIDKHPSITPWMYELPLSWPGLRLVYLRRYPMAILGSIKRKLADDPSREPGINWATSLPAEFHALPKMHRACMIVTGAAYGLAQAKERGYPVLEVDYESLCGHRGADVCGAVWEFAGLPVPPMLRACARDRLPSATLAGRVDAWKTELNREEVVEYDKLLVEYGLGYDRGPVEAFLAD